MPQKDKIERPSQDTKIDKKEVDNTNIKEFTNREFYKENESLSNDKQYIGELSDEELEKISGGSATSHKRHRC